MPQEDPAAQEIIDPDLPIVDTHHHLWDAVGGRAARYMFDDLLADTHSGHKVCATVYVECRSMYRADGPEHLRVVGETEFANGVAAMAASGLYGEARLCAAIVSSADLRLEEARVAEVLEAHIAAGGGRFRGVRCGGAWDADPSIVQLLTRSGLIAQGLYGDRAFRAGFARLAPLGLSFDAFVLEPQLEEVVDLARAFPDTRIVLNHVGVPLAIGAYARQRGASSARWRAGMKALAGCDNVWLKVGGLGMPFLGVEPQAPFERLVQGWRPYVEQSVEIFGAERCMFESNFPVDGMTVPYPTLWNVLKTITAGCSAVEKARLFAGTGAEAYRIQL